MTTSNPRMPDPLHPLSRPTRRQMFPLLGAAAAAAALAPASLAFAQGGPPAAPAELGATQSGTLAGNTGGSFAYYQLTRPSGAALTVTLSFSPFDGVFAHAVGFNVYQHGAKLGGAAGQSAGLGDAGTNSSPTTTVTPTADGGPALVQVFNYSPNTVAYTLSSSVAGVAGGGGARLVYVGAYTQPSGKAGGIGIFQMDAAGTLTPVKTVATVNPSFLALDPSQRFLYAVNELGDVNGKHAGAVSAFAVNAGTGDLTLLNQQLTDGTYPAHLTVDPTGKYVLAANYGTGNFVVFPIQADGSLGAMSDEQQDSGTGPNTKRQEGPHAHMITFDPAGKFVFGVDLGNDHVNIWHLDTTSGKLIPNSPPSVTLAPGSGPRHIAFHPNSQFAYVISELASSITAFSYDAAHGMLQQVQAVSTLPDGFTGTSACAEIVVAPSGKYVYGSNRGNDSIVIFAIDQVTGKLSRVVHESVEGKTPRNFNMDPTGTFLYAANQDSDTIVTFHVDQTNGTLAETGPVLQTPTPVCVLFKRL